MPISIQFFGAVAYLIVTARGTRVLIDPFLRPGETITLSSSLETAT